MLTQGTRVLITGGAGFIGSHVARALAASGCEVRVLDDLSTGKRDRLAGLDGIELLQGDVRNPAAVCRAMHGMAAVVHLAGVQPGVDAIRAQDVNLGGALHILNFARELAPRERPRVVLCGSASVYGRQTGFVLHEELTPRPMTPEAVMALAMEQYGRVYRESFGVPVVNLRIFRVFGPDEEAERSDAGIVAKFIAAALDGKSPVIFGDGQQTRDLIHVDNVVAAVMAALTVEDPPAEPLNIASGEAVAMNFLWNLVLECCGKRRLAIDPTYVPAPPWEAKHSRPQIARACKVLGWAPAVRLREGLQRTVEHYQGLRNVDPNAWFAPKDEPGAGRKKALFPSVNVPTRRFGSVVTPAFGVPAMEGSQAAPLPRSGSVASTLPRSNSVASTLPRSNSVASTLPRSNSVASPLPRPGSVAAPMPRSNSAASTLPRTNSAASPLPRSSSAAAIMGRTNSVASTLPRGNSVASTLPRTGSAAGPLPRSGSGSAPLPRPGSVASTLPHSSSTASPPPHSGTPASSLSRTGSTTAATSSTATLRQGATPPPSAHSTAGVLPRPHAKSARPTPPMAPPKPKPRKEEVLEVSDADVLTSDEADDDDLHFEWAPVPAVPGMGR
jgi:nucleoside-diphosphate-sugar epimerase